MLANYEKGSFYQEENKLAWAKISNKDPQLILSVFRESKEIEEKLGKDICNFFKDDILMFYTSLMSTSADRLNNINSMLRSYTDWCIGEHIVKDRQNHFMEIEYNNLIKCVNLSAVESGILTREQMENWAKGEVSNLCNVACIFLLFEGVKGNHYEELLNVTFDDVVGDKIILPNREIILSKACVELLNKAAKEDSYTLPHGRNFKFLDNKIYRSYRKDQLEPKCSIPSLVGQVGKRLCDCYYEKWKRNCSLNSISVSGQIDFVKRISGEQGKKVSEYILTKECYDQVYDKFRITTWIGKKFYSKYQSMLEE